MYFPLKNLNLFYYISLQLAEAHKIVVSATDGVWESIDESRCTELVWKWQTEGKSAAEVSQLLCQTAIKEGSADNVCATVTYLASSN